ncbi:hypothetical protein R1flu_018687 [Riccia fluitans]|uniref:2-C-methyl-D-erythritol 2,4-cyclodiphosphate synthase n=1 Tax=Riccia fluitans TaxID=41844 RepID=A0ABD1ZK18_9MARC
MAASIQSLVCSLRPPPSYGERTAVVDGFRLSAASASLFGVLPAIASSVSCSSRGRLELSRLPVHKARRSTICSASTVVDEISTKQLVKEAPVLPFRIGHGFDLHRLEPNLPLIIGGVNIPHDRGCEAHSDGDVLYHCVVDAILGALGLPDIGQIFPDNDPKWKGCTSDVFMKEAVRRMHEAGYVLGNLDATLILQRPKLSPHKETIRANLCELLQADPSVVNLKAKTHEKVDSLGIDVLTFDSGLLLMLQPQRVYREAEFTTCLLEAVR